MIGQVAREGCRLPLSALRRVQTFLPGKHFTRTIARE